MQLLLIRRVDTTSRIMRTRFYRYRMMLFLVTCAVFLSGAMAQIDLRPYNLTAAIMFVSNDLNNDSVLTQHEFEKVFAIYDFNKDKVIERHEYVCYITKSNSFMASLAHALYDEFDSDNDHRLDIHDFDIFFKKMDQNSDKRVSDLEFINYWEKLFLKTENHSLHGHTHPQHTDSYCTDHGYAHG